MDEETIVAYLDYSSQSRQHLYDLRKWWEPEEGMAKTKISKYDSADYNLKFRFT
jgi:hypothetical protein